MFLSQLRFMAKICAYAYGTDAGTQGLATQMVQQYALTNFYLATVLTQYRFVVGLNNHELVLVIIIGASKLLADGK